MAKAAPNIRDLGTGMSGAGARPMSSAVEIDGLNELRKALKAVGESTADIKAANLEAAGIVRNKALDLVPVRSGELKKSIRAAGQERWGVVRAGKGGTVPYAGPIHFGWARRNIEPQPFLYDALDDRRDEVMAAYEANLAEVIRKQNL